MYIVSGLALERRLERDIREIIRKNVPLVDQETKWDISSINGMVTMSVTQIIALQLFKLGTHKHSSQVELQLEVNVPNS